MNVYDLRFLSMENIYLHDARTLLQVDMERFVTGEVFLQPELVGIEAVGIPKFIFDSIQASPMDYRTPLYANVVLSGACSAAFYIIYKRLSEIMRFIWLLYRNWALSWSDL